MTRKIIVPIDSIIALFSDYTKSTGDIPYNTQALSLQINPAEQGKFRIMADSPDWKHGLPPLKINFEIKRVYSA